MTITDLGTILEARGLGRYFERMKGYARNAVWIDPVVVPEDQIPVGASKFGGHPDLPEDFQWPWRDEGYPLLFMGQVNLAEVAPYDAEGKLPQEGMLYFFFDVQQIPSLFWDEWDGWAVRYYPGCDVTRSWGPTELPGYFAAARLEYTARAELPFLFSDLIHQDTLEGNEYWDLWDWNIDHAKKNGEESDISTKLLGHACPVQTCGMEQTCEEAYRKRYGAGEVPHEDPKDPRCAERWLNLLQLDSHQELGWSWDGGYGRVYFWITEEDLKQRRFDRVLADFQAT